MNSFETRHRLAALLIFLTALVLYLSTMAPTTSFWDCGEFITASYTLSVPHPPGAPFYLLLGRLFSMLPFPADIGARVNLISPVASALTVMLLYLSVIHLLAYWKTRTEMGLNEIFGAATGALVFMASDSFWFNAVEAEVYAISMLFTALVVWLAFVWHDRVSSGRGDGSRMLLLVFYIIGLAIGVHLLNVLALPMVFMVIYFHNRPKDELHMRLFWLGLCTLSILPVYPGVVLYFPRLVAAYGAGAIPAVLLALAFVFWVGQHWRQRWLSLSSAAILLMLLGYLSYVLILVRSGLNPPLDENDPQTIQGLIAYLSREQYGSQSITDQLLNRAAPFWSYQIQHMYNRYLGWNFLGQAADGSVNIFRYLALPALLAIWGMATHWMRDRHRAITISALFFLTGYAIVIYLNQTDPQPRERDYSYVGSFFAIALWVGIGAADVLERLREWLRKPGAGLAAGVLMLLVVPGLMTARGYHEHDRTGNYVAWDYAWNALNMLEPDAILFTNGDNDTFPLWYLQEVEGIRRDVRVVNLSLLNTGWYIRQLRDIEPKVPLSPEFTDEFITSRIDGGGREAIFWRYWGPSVWVDNTGKPLPRELWYRVPMSLENGERFSVRLEPSIRLEVGDGFDGPNFIRVQDRMILEILRAANWKRPVYMAITVPSYNFAGTYPLYRMDGLAFKMLGEVGPHDSDPAILEATLAKFETHFRGLNDPDVFFDSQIERLVQNYRSTYLELARAYEGTNDVERILATVDRMEKFMPPSVIPVAVGEHRRTIEMYKSLRRIDPVPTEQP
ncbi:MAG: DUF2723 domain-containing protein [Candidatus Delongbacteria bacterium]|nr:DUF2723 domain-containing protein [Candidatus Delongbacteria bacterium]